MASLTIRRLDDQLKKRLRVRAASHGRSLEEELRQILAEASTDAASSRSTGDAADRATDRVSGSQSRLRHSPVPGEKVGDSEPSLGAIRILLIIGGGIAAYKSLDLIRRLRERGAEVRCILTRAAQEFVTPLAAGALCGAQPFTDLFDPRGEFDVGHIRLARDCDLIVVAPATADLMAKMAGGHADDLATAVLLATDRPVLIAPAMNPRMWMHPATRRNFAQLAADGVTGVGPNAGEMAEAGEAGIGRMAEPLEIVTAAWQRLGEARGEQPLAGRRIVVTSGPTHEPIDPVRYIANRSSGKQGHAIAAAAAAAGAKVVLISGPVAVADPPGVRLIKVETARDMLDAVERAMPADCAIFAAAVADWRVSKPQSEKIKKGKIAGSADPKNHTKGPALALVENPDILSSIAQRKAQRPRLVIGFAAETEHVIDNAKDKLKRKGCDWIVANDVSPAGGVMGGDLNTVHLVTTSGVESWPQQSKDEVARALIARIAAALGSPQ